MCRRSALYLKQHFGGGSGQILLDDLRCSGDETSLGSCRHDGWGKYGSYYCYYHYYDVSVICGNGKYCSMLETSLVDKIIYGRYELPTANGSIIVLYSRA